MPPASCMQARTRATRSASSTGSPPATTTPATRPVPVTPRWRSLPPWPARSCAPPLPRRWATKWRTLTLRVRCPWTCSPDRQSVTRPATPAALARTCLDGLHRPPPAAPRPHHPTQDVDNCSHRRRCSCVLCVCDCLFVCFVPLSLARRSDHLSQGFAPLANTLTFRTGPCCLPHC